MKLVNPEKTWTTLHVGWAVIVMIAAAADVVLLWYSSVDGTLATVASTVAVSVWRGLLWILCWYAGFYALVAASLLLASRRAFGTISAESRETMARLADISQAYRLVRGGRALLVIGGLLGAIGAFALSEYRLLFASGLAAVCLVWLRIRVSTPPFLVFLGTSTPRGIKLHHLFKRAAAPGRVVSLLAIDVSEDDRLKNELHLDCLRTNVDKEWFAVIEILLKMAPLIVMDGCQVTSAIHREREHILDPKNGLAHKCIFFSSSFPACPVLDTGIHDLCERRSMICCVPDGVAIATAAESRIANALPTASNPIRELARLVEQRLCRQIERQSIARVDSLLGQSAEREVACSICGRAMFILTGAFVPRATMQQSQGCYQCAACRGYTCYECSDSRKRCRCGAQRWIEKMYLPGV